MNISCEKKSARFHHVTRMITRKIGRKTRENRACNSYIAKLSIFSSVLYFELIRKKLNDRNTVGFLSGKKTGKVHASRHCRGNQWAQKKRKLINHVFHTHVRAFSFLVKKSYEIVKLHFFFFFTSENLNSMLFQTVSQTHKS